VRTNVYEQRQEGFVAASINLPLGDITSRQTRTLADIVRRYTGDSLRTTVDQNFFIRWVHQHDLVALYNDLREAKLAGTGSGTITDVTTCPGTDTCKLGIASSRGLGVELRERMSERGLQNDPVLKDVNIGVSGCPNSCGLHHISDIGFYGSSRNVGAYKVPHFQLMLGGSLANNAGNYSLALGAFPSKRAPQVVDRLLDLYSAEREGSEDFRGWVLRVGKKVIKEKIQDLTQVPTYEEDSSFYVDWHDSREYSIGDIGVGECAGEVVSLTHFSLAAAESMTFDASILVDEAGDEGFREAAREAYRAMITAAQGLLKVSDPDVSDLADVVFPRFQAEFLETGRFFERHIGANESQYLIAAQQVGGAVRDRDEARRRVQEAGLFIEACHACYARILQAQNTVTAAPGVVNS
jgi:sulfite reductase (ferredoxin)